MADITTTILCITALLVPSLGEKVNVLYEWNYLNFTWPTEAAYTEAVNSGAYIPKNNIVTGIKVWKDQVYLTISRWKKGVPALLATVPVNPKNGERAPLLQPYPNWEMQKLGDCSALQFVQSMEIDPRGRMWVLENGRTELKSKQPRTECPNRLIIFDLENEGDAKFYHVRFYALRERGELRIGIELLIGKILLNYQFPSDVVHRKSSFLNDIVVDHEDGGWAYISDSDDKFPGIVVFSLKGKKSWKVSHDPSMQAPPEAIKFKVDGKDVEIRLPLDGIALSPASSKADRILYYTPLTSYEMYTIPVNVVRNPRLKAKDYIKSIGKRSSTSDGLVITAKGDMYYGLAAEDSVSRWPISAKVFTKESQKVIFQDSNVNQWADTFAIDDVGRLWWTTNRLPRFEGDKVDITEPNYRVIFTEIEDRSYMYNEDFTSPKFPDITS